LAGLSSIEFAEFGIAVRPSSLGFLTTPTGRARSKKNRDGWDTPLIKSRDGHDPVGETCPVVLYDRRSQGYDRLEITCATTGDLMPKSALSEIATDELVRKRLAKLMALECFRNSKLEDLHAGISPNSQSGDYSDVKVVTPYGEISWQRLGRFSDDEMKVLMIDVVDRCYEFLSELLDERSAAGIIERLRLRDPLPRWNDPRTRS
jgi:hypothetical protein